jgi:serine/threonine protein kinase/tetratricopeptide (TPR) repeat protein
MTGDDLNLDTIFTGAIEIASGEERAAFVAHACGTDEELRRRVQRLVDAHFQAGSFLESPLASPTSPMPPASSTELIGAVIGPYKLLQVIGEGGMGTVYMAEQTQPVRRVVALKLIKTGMDNRHVLARFGAERQALALMDHPNIAKVFDAGTTDNGRPYFVMELVKGVAITKFCDERRLTLRERLELAIPVCQAVQHAHQKGIIHRDLKPSNVLIALYDGKPVPKVIDFGVAKATGPRLTDQTLFTEFGAVVGTLEYMSPEQAELNQLDIDTRSDIYSLGVLLYELLTGSTPLEHKRLKSVLFLEVLRLIREEESPRPSMRLSTTEELPSIAASRNIEPRKLSGLMRGELDWIVMKALEKDRNRRYETANGIAADLRRYLLDEPVEACSPSARYRLTKFLRRHRLALRVAAAFVLLLLLGTAVSIWLALRAQEQRQRAVVAEARARDERDQAEKARALADRNFQKARTAVEDYLQKVTDNPDLKNRGGLHDLRKQLLAAALPFFEEFVKEKGDDPALRFDQGRAYFRLAAVRAEMGEREEALRDYAAARDISLSLTANFPTVGKYRQEAARSLSNLATLLGDLGKQSEAEAACRLAIGYQEKLAGDFPEIVDYRRELANSQTNLGRLMNRLGRQGEAVSACRLALALQEELVVRFPANADYRHALANTYHNLSAVLRDLGKRTEAETAYREQSLIREKLVADFPAVPEYRRGLAASHNFHAVLLAGAGNRAEAEPAFRQALAVRDKLAADFPDVPQYRQDLAFTHDNLGRLQQELGKPAEAEASCRQALVIQEKLAADYPDVPQYRQDLARTHNNLGNVLKDLGKQAAADTASHQAMKLLEKLAADSPAVPVYRIDLAGSYVNFGRLLDDRGESGAALGWYTKAIPVLEAVLTQVSHVSTAQRYLAIAYSRRALTLMRLARHVEALNDWDRALALDNGSNRVMYRQQRALTLAHTGDHIRAVAEAEDLTRGDQVSGGSLYDAACICALSAAAVIDDAKQQEAYAARAVGMLRRAQATGYFNDSQSVQHLKQDDDLAALRARNDFQNLLKELGSKKQN